MNNGYVGGGGGKIVFGQNMDALNPIRIILDVTIWIMITIPIFVLKFATQPYQRGFYCDDESIRYPFKESTVTNIMLFGFGFAIPIITIILVEAYRTFYFEPTFLRKIPPSRPICRTVICHPYIVRLYYYVGYFLFGAAICQVLTDIGKYTTGRLRPHFMDVCKPNFEQNVGCANFTYVMAPSCTSKNLDLLKEARLSFPSGHASFSFYAMTFATLYVQAQIVWPVISVVLKSTVQFIFVCLAVMTSLSRVSDYKHHWSDVLTGTVLGITVALIVSVYFVGLFRYPKQQIFVEGIIAPDAVIIQNILTSSEKSKEAQSQNIPMSNVSN